ncbi:kinetochore-associated Ndc80 complex subunit ndc80 [Coniosporium tulheliwenetii]|uniref:Kinetochore-associated Ndc80 complex subunit ndc80 n=1 Tax=Coniosporium tulheliwenetii TaxID=3383036 RepID=A0ACC2ZPZ6_9PEZI|nr:kinetochore-associated Ndc80 complex subunit ndc80 [Cladosporium sp. JES 115]
MAQETGIFSVRRPRETLGGLSNNASAIPMPSSAMKRTNSMSNMQAPFTSNHMRSTSGSRMSLAPGRPSQPVFQRSSSGNNLAEMGFASVNRNSVSNANPFSTGGRKSYAPGAAQRVELRPRIRDTGGAHQSFFATAPLPATVPQDPRRVKENASVRQQMAAELLDYLTHNNFEMEMKHSLTQKAMTSPTQKDFNCMFQWLYHRIDPAYRFQKNIDAEVPPLLKQLRYPFEKNIMKSQIAAVGGNNWSTFLALLHWMMQLAKLMEAYAQGAYDQACMDVGFDVSADRIIFDFLSNAYREWLQVEDDDEDDAEKVIQPHVEAMAAKFSEANKHHLEHVAMLEAEHKKLKDEIEELGKNEPRIKELSEKIKIMESDEVKFKEYNSMMEAKVDKYQKKIELFDDEIRKVEKELEEAEQEKASLQEMLDKQGITIQDVDRMNTERERLQKGVESTSLRLEESKRKIAEKEQEANRKLDELERVVEKYNSLGYQIGIIPSTVPNAKGQDYELVLTINEGPNFGSSQMGSSQGPESDRLLADSGNGYQPHHILNLDVRGSVKSNILALRRDISERRNAALQADIESHDMLDQVKVAMDEKLADVEALGHKVRFAEEEFEKTREITTAQKMASDAQIERMEKEMGKMRSGLTESVQLMEQREMNTNLEYEQLTLRAASLREELHTEIERMLNDVIKFKVHIQKSLEDYEQFVAEEVEKECEEQEMVADDDQDLEI